MFFEFELRTQTEKAIKLRLLHVVCIFPLCRPSWRRNRYAKTSRCVCAPAQRLSTSAGALAARAAPTRSFGACGHRICAVRCFAGCRNAVEQDVWQFYVFGGVSSTRALPHLHAQDVWQLCGFLECSSRPCSPLYSHIRCVLDLWFP